MFLNTPMTLKVINQAQQSEYMFIFYFLGFYKQKKNMNITVNMNMGGFFDTEYPFFVLLLLLAFEKVSQSWLENKCNTMEDKISHYKDI